MIDEEKQQQDELLLKDFNSSLIVEDRRGMLGYGTNLGRQRGLFVIALNVGQDAGQALGYSVRPHIRR